MRRAILLLLLGALVIAGCCGPTGPSSGSCSLGTYGQACASLCNRMGEGEGCVSSCIDEVRARGMGDATTCCRGTYRDQCREICNEYGSYGMEECMADCAEQSGGFGLSMDECGLPV